MPPAVLAGMRTTPWVAGLAVASFVGVAGCQVATQYTPRTPGKVALAIERGEVAIYKSGFRTPLSSATPALLACSAPAGATAAKAADDQSSYRSKSTVAGLLYAVGVFAPPATIVGSIFAIQAASDQQDARAGLIDAINQHNDDAACASHRSTYARTSTVPRELIWAYDNRFQVTQDGHAVAGSGDWGGLSRAATCSAEARAWADSAASRDTTGKALTWTGVAMMVGATIAGSVIMFSDTDDVDQILLGGGLMLGGVVVGAGVAGPGLYLRASAETRAIDSVNRHNDELWSGRCR